MKVVVGGTFSYLHKGHIALISKAFEIGDYVCIGITSDDYANSMKPTEDVQRYAEREKAVEDICITFNKGFEIVPINDRFGPSTTGDYDAIIVTDETSPIAEEINTIRTLKGLKPLEIIRIGYVLSSDSIPISTLRIVKGEIDRDGNLIGGQR